MENVIFDKFKLSFYFHVQMFVKRVLQVLFITLSNSIKLWSCDESVMKLVKNIYTLNNDKVWLKKKYVYMLDVF